MTTGRTVAIIDAGSSSVRLLVVRRLTAEAFEVLDEERFDARLGQGQEGGNLTPEGIARGLRALRVVAQVARSYAPSALVAVGTEALRRAPNRDEFIEAVHRETGVELRVLSAAEEAEASFLGTINSTRLRDGHIVDVGGGSLEFMRVEGRRLVSSQSAPLGAIYATERFLGTDSPTRKEVRILRKAVRQQIEAGGPLPALIGVGGALRSLARLDRSRSKYPLRRLHGMVVSRRDFHRMTAMLVGMTADQRRKLSAINTARADIIHAAAIVVDEVMDLSGAEAIEISGQGLREGLAWKALRPEQPMLHDVRAASIAGLARANGVDVPGASAVALAAAKLFDATRALHGLDAGDREILLAAARLRGAGMHVDYYNRDRHAEYLVHSGALHGFTHREIVLLAALVRWASSGTPDLSPFRAIVEGDDAHRAAVLAALLGTAQAVYRRSPTPLRSFEPALLDDGLLLLLRGEGPLDAEVLALERQQKRLEAALKTPVQVSLRPA